MWRCDPNGWQTPSSQIQPASAVGRWAAGGRRGPNRTKRRRPERREAVNRSIHAAGLRTLLWFYLGRLKPGISSPAALDAKTRTYLHPTNPTLVELHRRYAAMNAPPHSCWASWERCIDLRRFRAENAYQSQAYFLQTLTRYRLTTAYVEARDSCGWLRSLGEDGRFGAKLWPVASGLDVTRDLLDSILELTWLKEMLEFGMDDTLHLLDIGAGYGRLAHRFTSLFPRASITCVDAIATSTFLCEFYLRVPPVRALPGAAVR